MYLELIAAIIAGLGAGGVALLLRRLSGNRLPGWLVPVAAGGAMIAYGIWSDYDWRDRTVAALPDGSVVLVEIPGSVWWKPWTLLKAPIVRLSAVYAAGARRREDTPGLVLAQVLLLARDAPPVALPVLVDCRNGRRADIADSEFGPDGMPIDPDWRDAPPDDPLLRALCGRTG